MAFLNAARVPALSKDPIQRTGANATRTAIRSALKNNDTAYFKTATNVVALLTMIPCRAYSEYSRACHARCKMVLDEALGRALRLREERARADGFRDGGVWADPLRVTDLCVERERDTDLRLDDVRTR